jgi:hypothetical protein
MIETVPIEDIEPGDEVRDGDEWRTVAAVTVQLESRDLAPALVGEKGTRVDRRTDDGGDTDE